MQYPMELVGFSCWRLWKARDHAVFDDRNWNVGQILEQAPHQYDDYANSLGSSNWATLMWPLKPCDNCLIQAMITFFQKCSCNCQSSCAGPVENKGGDHDRNGCYNVKIDNRDLISQYMPSIS
ncbi:hypothetical protein D5086_020620 [Populus alba]|uniref:Uncharacterized protein n=1 Tax=Populus alba TaxID=43335 RepID=A0ACC4BL65_POPAL